MKLELHASRELERAGAFDAGAPYGGMLGEAVMRLVRVFAAEGHSGMSASIALDMFLRVASFKVLTPITSNPDEWEPIDEALAFDGKALWQNRRQSSCFSNDGGKTYYDVDDDNLEIKVSAEPR